jgi:hypothetical protein
MGGEKFINQSLRGRGIDESANAGQSKAEQNCAKVAPPGLPDGLFSN